MSELSVRIRRVTEDLEAIQSQLDGAAQGAASERDSILRELANTTMLQDLKTAVDHMRHLLWSYIEAATKKGVDVQETLQTVRMQRVTEMLRILEPTVAETKTSHAPEAESFFDLIHQIANKTIERHGQGA